MGVRFFVRMYNRWLSFHVCPQPKVSQAGKFCVAITLKVQFRCRYLRGLLLVRRQLLHAIPRAFGTDVHRRLPQLLIPLVMEVRLTHRAAPASAIFSLGGALGAINALEMAARQRKLRPTAMPSTRAAISSLTL
eukprot:TRINITY_DN3658_c0_g1_i1.p1 TRINITY_DN3658_c0_g1~~TRINITY_DN3658_c0_g1_i1.p1  ORF type:complete len:134 (-),score=0.77 TRINITY_DN3658_c0_g1_i1:355-756(-)